MLDQLIDFFGGKFAGVFWHTAFAVADHGAQVGGGGGGGLFGDERGSAEVAAFSGLAVALGAVFPVDGVRGQGRVRRLGLGWGMDCEK